mmetsp:Transcript_1165/g.2454  ORF Transcript_1165/g.2454 Transcript_1165/m.2454 type:complete len:161 (+) Transcript_1165:1199-1681(+)
MWSVRHWGVYVKRYAKKPRKTHMLTRNTELCIEVCFHGFVALVRFLRENHPNIELHAQCLGSQEGEHTFRFLRVLCPGSSFQINFLYLSLLRKIARINSSLDSKHRNETTGAINYERSFYSKKTRSDIPWYNAPYRETCREMSDEIMNVSRKVSVDAGRT